MTFFNMANHNLLSAYVLSQLDLPMLELAAEKKAHTPDDDHHYSDHVIGVKIIINCVRQRVEQIQILLEEVLHKHDDHISTGQHIFCTSKIYGSFHNS